MVEKPFYFLTLVAASPDAAVFCRQESGALPAIRMWVSAQWLPNHPFGELFYEVRANL